MPIMLKIIKIVKKFWLNANEIADPKNGAEQGVASNTAKTPERKLGIKIFFFNSFLWIFLLRRVAITWLKLMIKTSRN